MTVIHVALACWRRHDRCRPLRGREEPPFFSDMLQAAMNAPFRRFAALLAVCSLAFAQLAVSAYACPMIGPAAATEVMSPDCPELNNANLCAEHCAYGTVTTDSHGVAFPVMDAAPLPWRAVASPVSPQARALRDWHLVLPSHPPPSIFFGVLRI